MVKAMTLLLSISLVRDDMYKKMPSNKLKICAISASISTLSDLLFSNLSSLFLDTLTYWASLLIRVDDGGSLRHLVLVAIVTVSSSGSRQGNPITKELGL